MAALTVRINMDAPANNEVRLNDVMFLALDHGMESIADDSGPLIPMVFTEDLKGERTLQRFVSEHLEEGVEKARQFVEQNKTSLDRYAIAWDGFVTVEGKKWDAILVEAGDRFQDTGYLMCQRYEKKGLLKKKNVASGNPVCLRNRDLGLKHECQPVAAASAGWASRLQSDIIGPAWLR